LRLGAVRFFFDETLHRRKRPIGFTGEVIKQAEVVKIVGGEQRAGA